jgi:conjugal transfer/type IV secretion protein DotA/TraY
MRLLLAVIFAAAALCWTDPAAAAPGGFARWNWSMLDPGDDWTAEVLRGVFPTMGLDGSGDVANQRTVLGIMAGMATAFIGLIAVAYFLYTAIIQVVAAGERGRVVDDHTSYLATLRITIAVILCLPIPGIGTNVGQAVVMRTAMASIGAARLVWSTAMRALGPDAVPIAVPIIPGTKTVVASLLDNELCRAMVNAAANNPAMMPPPVPVMGGAGSGAYVSWHYRLATGNARGAPVCGTVTVRQAGGAGQGVAGVDLDMAERQRALLQEVADGILRPAAEAAALDLRNSREARALAPLWDAFRSGVDAYSSGLMAAAQEVQQRLRGSVTADIARGGPAARNAERMEALGWSGAGAYWLMIADINGATLSVLASTPVVNPPTYLDLGPSLSRDLAPMLAAAGGWRVAIQTHAQTLDGQDVPGGYADLFTGKGPGEDGTGVLERISRSLRLNERVLDAFIDMTAPSRQMWQNPFLAQIELGHKLMLAALTALGMMAVLGSTPLAAGIVAASALTGNLTGAAAAATGHVTVQLLGTPIFYGILLLLGPGIALAFILPMLPFSIWAARVLGWLVQVLEILVAVPLWAWAMIRWRGEGLHGHGFHGFAVTATMIVTPVLMLIGLFLGFVVYAAWAWFLGMAFGIAGGFVIGKGWLVSNLIGVGVLCCIFVLLHMWGAVQAFRLISVTPHHVVAYAGLLAGNRIDVDDAAHRFGSAGMAATLAAIQGMAGSALEGARSGAATAGGAAGRIGSDRTLSAATDTTPPQPEPGNAPPRGRS